MAKAPDLNPKPIPSSAEINAQKHDKPAHTKVVSEPVLSAKPEATTAGGWPGAFNVIQPVFEQIKKNPQPAYVFVAVYTVLATLTQLSNGFTTSVEDKGVGLESMTALIFLLALPVYALALADRKAISIEQFLNFDLTKYLTIFGATLLTVLIVIFSAIPLFVPLIWTVPWFALASYAIVDKGMGVIDSLKESRRLARDNKGKVWGVLGVTIILALAAGVFSFIPVVGPAVSGGISLVSAGILATLYRWLQQNVPADV